MEQEWGHGGRQAEDRRDRDRMATTWGLGAPQGWESGAVAAEFCGEFWGHLGEGTAGPQWGDRTAGDGDVGTPGQEAAEPQGHRGVAGRGSRGAGPSGRLGLCRARWGHSVTSLV